VSTRLRRDYLKPGWTAKITALETAILQILTALTTVEISGIFICRLAITWNALTSGGVVNHTHPKNMESTE
jgi:hypothetical protein